MRRTRLQNPGAPLLIPLTLFATLLPCMIPLTATANSTPMSRLVVCSGLVPPSGSIARAISFYSADGTPRRLELHDVTSQAPESVPELCDSASLPVAAADVSWFGPVTSLAEESPTTFILQGRFDSAAAVSEVEQYPPPAGAESEAAGRESADAGSGKAVVSVSEEDPLRGTRRAGPAVRDGTIPHSAWVWSPAIWSAHADALWRLADKHRLDGIFITVPVEDGGVADASALGGFLRKAARRGIAVWAVVGDPRDVLPEALPALHSRALAYLAYNRSAPGDARLAGLQLDVEPYLLPGFVLAPHHWRERYLAMFRAVHETLDGAMPLDLVVPVWWGNHPAWGVTFLEGIARPGVSLTVMNYRTQPDALRAGAVPFLNGGAEYGLPVRMALETGLLPDESRRRYDRVAGEIKGELWGVAVGDLRVLILLKEPRADRSGLNEARYAFRYETPFAASNLTFGAGPESAPARENLIRELAVEWSAWESFAGIAWHGLDADLHDSLRRLNSILHEPGPP